MPTKKIDEKTSMHHIVCSHPEHNPPSMQVFMPGLYEHECPKCGSKKMFRVNAIVGMAQVASRSKIDDEWSRGRES